MNYAQRQDVYDSVAAGDEELASLHNAVSQQRAQLATLTRAADTVAQYRDIIVTSEASHEPMTPTTVRLIEAGVNHAMATCGLERAGISLESVDGESTISLEAISDRLKNLWERIKMALAKLSDTLSKLFAKFLDSAQKTQQKAQKIEAKLGSGTRPADQPIEMDLGNLCVGNTVPNNFPSLSVDILGDLAKYVVDNGEAEKFLNDVIGVMRNSSVDQLNSTENANVVNLFASAVGKRLQAIRGAGASTPPAYGDQVVASTGKLLGNTAIVCTYSKPGSTMVNTLQQFSVTEWAEQRPDTLPKSITPLTVEQIKPILEAVKTSAMTISGISSYLETLRGFTAKMVELGDTIVTKTPEDKQTEVQLPLSMLSRAVDSVTSSFDIAIKYNYRLSGTLLTLCDKSTA